MDDIIKILIPIILIAITPSSSNAQTLPIRICNCTHPETKGIVNTAKPAYCQQGSTATNITEVHYVIHAEERGMHWKGYACSQWLAQKEVSIFFWGSHDTILRKSILKVTPEECWKTITYQQMCGNSLMQPDGKTYKFIHEPTGEGKWMTTQKYTIKNCFTQEIPLSKECESCNISSPFGFLTVNLKTTPTTTT